MHAFAAFVAFLGFQAECGDGAGHQAGEADWLAGLLTEAVVTLLDSPEGGVDLGDQLALAVARAQFQSPIRLGRSAIGQVRMIFCFFLKMIYGFSGFPQDIFLPIEQPFLEEIKLPFVHERLIL
jgi:hypothetical protein